MANTEVKVLERTYDDPNSDIKMGAYLVRDSFYMSMIHRKDDVKNVGFDWRSNLMKKTLSTYLLSNDNVDSMIDQYRVLLVYLIDRVQDIRKGINYTVDKFYKYSS